jgi:molybdopterin converting factor small subunit
VAARAALVRNAMAANATGTTQVVPVEVHSWITKFIGGDGSGRRVIDEPWTEKSTIRSVLRGLSARYPDLQAALWHGNELGEHVEVIVNDAILGVTHDLDSSVKPGDRIMLLGQFMGG